MRFGDLVKQEKRNALPISARHDKWLEENSNAVYSPEAKQFLVEQIGKPDRRRKGTISASSVYGCKRKQQFTWLGLYEDAPSPRTANIFHNGTMTHLRWQMAGLTEGWLTVAEVPIGENPMSLSGTMDGIDFLGRVVEIKSAHHDNYLKVVSFGPITGHLHQMAGYMLATGRTEGVFLYEDKNTQEYVEVPVTRDEVPLSETEARVAELWGSVEGQHLYEPMSKCIDREGMMYRLCPFKSRCLQIMTWSEAEEAANEDRP